MCAEGFVKKIEERPAAVCAGACCCVHGFKELRDLQLNAQIKLRFCSKLNRTQFVDVSPTLGVNHVKSGVVVSCVVSISTVFYALIIV